MTRDDYICLSLSSLHIECIFNSLHVCVNHPNRAHNGDVLTTHRTPLSHSLHFTTAISDIRGWAPEHLLRTESPESKEAAGSDAVETGCVASRSRVLHNLVSNARRSKRPLRARIHREPFSPLRQDPG